MTTIDWTALAAPFRPDQIEWRIGECGVKQGGEVWAKCFAYMDNRAVQIRLDEVVGPGNWQCKFEQIDGGFLCGIGIKIWTDDEDSKVPTAEWVWQWDGAEKTDFEAIKGGLSGAMKRAAVHWGLGRYLYDLPEGWAETSLDRKPNWNYAKTKDGKAFYWQPPRLPEWALPKGTQGQAVQERPKVEPEPAQTHETQPSQTEPQKPSQGGSPYKERVCPNCGKSEHVRKSKLDSTPPWYCFKKIGGCGHQWGDAEGVKEQVPGLTTGDKILTAAERYTGEIDKAVKAKDGARLEKLQEMIAKSLDISSLTIEECEELDRQLQAGKKAIKSAAEYDRWHAEKVAEAQRREQQVPPELQEVADRF